MFDAHKREVYKYMKTKYITRSRSCLNTTVAPSGARQIIYIPIYTGTACE